MSMFLVIKDTHYQENFMKKLHYKEVIQPIPTSVNNKVNEI
jgi:hypothetical protein